MLWFPEWWVKTRSPAYPMQTWPALDVSRAFWLCFVTLDRAYFQTGTLPEVGTLCQADLKPLVGSPLHPTSQNFSAADRRLFDALMAEVHRGPLIPML
ncbi:unnamed protein product [Penicillium camemberti]|uniref:Str. FM013 n=1 Tax=Penicillium camemberti (strain FM 013) TaxID=1429867 RepID=A0A0G4PU45_PENC3|nr:unnamed protein product [Penicillium camemberti]